MGSDLCRGVSPPGTAPEEHRSGAPSRLSPDPRLRGLPLGLAENFRRAKSERYSKFPPGHWALVLRKISNDALPLPRLALFSQRSRSIFRCRGAQCAPAGRRGRRPLRHSPAVFCMFRRGGCPHPPEPSPLGEGAERSEADEVRRGGTPGPPQAFYKADRGAVFHSSSLDCGK